MDPLLNQMLGQYHILAELGRGGMGVVYKAWQATLNRYVAVKVLPPHFAHDPEFVRRFAQEAQNAAALSHSNIVRIYDFGMYAGYQYIVMELIEGETLETLRARSGALPPARAINILAQIASALDYAHSRGIVHRDVKPANILVGANDHATLTDFGIAKALVGTQIARASSVIGTPEYMAPEQIQNQPITAQSDVYALGIVAFELFTGRTPFQGDTAAILHAQVYQAPPFLQSFNPQIPSAIQASVLRALAKHPQQRHPTAAAFTAELRGQSSTQPINQLAPARAGSLRRLFGLIVDLIVWFILFALLAATAGRIPATSPVSSLTTILFVLGAYAYFVFPWMWAGQTIGQMVLGIRVISTNSTNPTWWQATLRWFVQVVTIVLGASIIFYILLVYLWHKFDKPPHDQITGTEAIRTRSDIGRALAPIRIGQRAGGWLAGITPLLLIMLIGFVAAPTNASPVASTEPTPFRAAIPPTTPSAPPVAIATRVPTTSPTPLPLATRIPTSTPIALITRAAAEINLHPRDLAGFAITDDQGREYFGDPDLRDASYREFTRDTFRSHKKISCEFSKTVLGSIAVWVNRVIPLR